jgi:transcriptional regulator with PAS, ATPase and Fis domain
MSTVLRPQVAEVAEGFCGLVGRHPSMLALFDRIQRAARQNLPVLIVGETGVGKELAAQALHALSGARGPLIPLNVAMLSEHLAEAELFGTVRGAFTGAVDRPGLIEAAAGGTLFLDEASELSLGTQARLLRALESYMVRRVGARHEYPVQFRLLLSLQRPAADLVAQGRWREDFCYRVNGITLSLPPVRDRQEGVPLLINHALRRLGLAPIAADELRGLGVYSWPGNVREVIRVVERAVFAAGSDPVSIGHLEAELGGSATDTPVPGALGITSRQAAERAYVEGALKRAGNAKAAAMALDLSIHQLYRRLRSLGIKAPRLQ